MRVKTDIFDIPARRCKRCGGILTSEQGLRDGYGSCCLKKMKEEAAEAKMRKNQISFFDREGETK
ncbi:hypothetical protein [Pseudoflavonifractor sp. An85]|uniref:hypothetical protein n=1 Tax=Pseudoflavonifractor sp. An85 TaxID=1965661 RepID=UPI00117A892A|nr:hypothetical protein [Pseudoflavonifractor sp. An85]